MLVLLASLAYAVPREICLEVEVLYDDADINGLEDYFVTNANRPLRGARLYYKPTTTGIYTYVNVDFDGSSPGCTTLDLSPTTSYDLKVSTLAVVDGHDINVVNSLTGIPWEVAFPSQSFLLPGSYQIVVNQAAGPSRYWNVLAASSFALHRRDGGLSSAYGVTFHLTGSLGTLSSPCGGASCISGTDIYLDDDLAYRKFDTVYAMGRTFLNYLGLAASQLDKTAPNSNCGGTSAGLALQSIEHDSAASVAGYAHFYAATVFNDTTESDCGYVNRLEANWDMQGGVCYDAVESPAGHVLSCATGPTMVPQRNQRAYCAQRTDGYDPGDNKSVPIDWVRYLWELQAAGTVTFGDVTAAYDDAIHDSSWTATGSGAGTALDNAGLFIGDSDAHGVTP